jgi:hypothetical protein
MGRGDAVIIIIIICAGDKIETNEMVGKPEGKRPLERPRRRRGNNIKMDLQQVGSGGVD